eukprot:CAMPEP_0181228926 /NCGR_PEP_ID=MMETSP1096-20121128/33614_1 /TAXON_ID=156174 ORGANISM="Chrysochromulina ericina, Strain CCMP281" /NCGR_SAMPLE_ID=MMETSP1096 /ASSEMBLY_ACC=CAM_ASM_000453 /LENGTH=223 /DNA_ID=CAMNT_0023322495 /DNA_START=1 /DNA_END=672 /DNA_ORIENTATION=-
MPNMPLAIRRRLPAAMRTSWTDDMSVRGHSPSTTPVGLGGFEVAFGLPFARADVWSELTKVQNPLGSNPYAEFELYGEGRRKLEKGERVRQGMKRVVFFKEASDAGQIISELTDLFERDTSSFMKWRQTLSSKGGLQLLGLGDRKPEFSFGLMDDGTPEGTAGCTLFLTYDFYSVSFNRGSFGSGNFFYEGARAAEYVRSVLEPNIREAFEDDMLLRGYKKLE